MRDFAKKHSARIDEFTDFVPTLFFVNQGLMLHYLKK